MILFHVPSIDSGDLRLWWRTVLPAYLLRRAGVAAKVVVGDVPVSNFPGASAIVFGGAISALSVKASQRARAAGLRVILDLADTRSLTVDMVPVGAVARAAHLVTVGNAELATLAAAAIGSQVPLREVADAIAPDIGLSRVLASCPVLGARLIAQSVKLRALDIVRRVRARYQYPRQKPDGAGPRIVWLGDGVGLNQEGGLGELLLAAGDLVDISQNSPFRLRVIGTSRRWFRRTINQLPIATEFRRLTLPTLARDLRGADLCFLPGAGDPASRARSTARAALARSLGIPVLTVPRAEATGPRGNWAATDWRSALGSWLAKGGRDAPIGAAAPIHADAGAIIDAWRDVASSSEPLATTGRAAEAAARQPRRLRVLFLLMQVQDLDLICPVAEAASLRPDMEVSVAVLTKITASASRRLRPLRERGAGIIFWHRLEVAGGKVKLQPNEFDVVMTACDGTAPGARYGALLIQAANAAGTATLNIQHGLDNSGLTFGPPPILPDSRFQSRFVLTWGGLERLTAACDDETRARVIPVGCPKRLLRREEVPDFPLAGQPIIAVFENLHWARYDDAYRRRFVRDLVAAATAAPDLTFVLKPHMGGRWFSRQSGLTLPANLVVADPQSAQWRRFTADSFLAHAAAVITTPSTIALDAARYELPVALAAYGIEAANCAPLLRIEETDDWSGFVQLVRTRSYDMARVRAFYRAAVVPGDAVARILDVIRDAGAGRTQHEIRSRIGEFDRTVQA